MEAEAPGPRGAPATPPGRPAAERVYRLAGALGAELQRLSGLVGPGAVAGLVAQVVRLLELLEALAEATDAAAAAAPGDGGGAEGPGRAGPPRQGASAPAPGAPAGGAASPESGSRESAARAPEQRLARAQERARLLESRLAQAEEENRRLLARLAGSQSQEESTLRKEREVMLRLKEVVDRQRDEIRAQAHEILCKARDTEALQEQLDRFMSMNEELRRKLAVVQAQLQSALERKESLEGSLREARREAERLRKDGGGVAAATSEPPRPGAQAEGPAISGERDPSWNAFSREELRQVLQERNELKTSLFLVQEELAYYQRELLNDERIPSILLEAVKTTIRRQRKKIRAKMLGTAEEPLSSEEEEEEAGWLAGTPGSSDCVDGHLPGSRIKSFFGQWYRRSSKSSSPEEGGPGAWEIVDPQEAGPAKVEEEEEEEEEEERPSTSGSTSPSGETLSLS